MVVNRMSIKIYRIKTKNMCRIYFITNKHEIEKVRVTKTNSP